MSDTPSLSREALDEKALEAAARKLAGMCIRRNRQWDTPAKRLEENIAKGIEACWRDFLPEAECAAGAYLSALPLPASILEIVSEVKRLDKEWRELRNPLATPPSVGGARERWLQWQLANVCIQLAEFIQRTTETRGT